MGASRTRSQARSTPLVAVLVAAALACSSGCSGCKSKQKSAPSAHASAAKSAKPSASLGAAKPKPPPTRPAASGDGPDGRPAPAGDPILGAISAAPDPGVKLDRSETLPVLGVRWRIPADWVTEEIATSPKGRREIRRKASHAPGDGGAYFDVLEANVENQKALMWKGQDYPALGMKPDPGEDKRNWVPFASVALGPAKIPGVATHAEDGDYVYTWIFFRHPKTGSVVQLMLTWPAGDAEAQKLLASIAGTVSAD